MFQQLVKTLVVERGHELGVGGTGRSLPATGRGEHGERPLLFLSGQQPVAERFPRQTQTVVDVGAYDFSPVDVGDAITNPRNVHHEAVAITLFIR